MTPKIILLVQGLYYLITALWPLLHIKSFEKITGPKTDHWLVYTVSLMILCSALVFLSSALNDFMIAKEVIILSISNVLVLSAVDIVFVLKKRIRKVYLLDAAAELAIGGALIISL